MAYRVKDRLLSVTSLRELGRLSSVEQLSLWRASSRIQFERYKIENMRLGVGNSRRGAFQAESRVPFRLSRTTVCHLTF